MQKLKKIYEQLVKTIKAENNTKPITKTCEQKLKSKSETK